MDILIIEDDAGVRESLCELLQMEGFAVRTAENGAIGLQLAEAMPPPCLILLDLMMPVMDGWQVLAALKTTGDCRLASLPVTVVSAAADVDDLWGRFKCEVIPKPINIDRLLDVAARFCKRTG